MRGVVIDQTSKQVLRHGFCDFENDGEFDGETETILESLFLFEPDPMRQDWYWNGSTFQTDPLE